MSASGRKHALCVKHSCLGLSERIPSYLTSPFCILQFIFTRNKWVQESMEGKCTRKITSNRAPMSLGQQLSLPMHELNHADSLLVVTFLERPACSHRVNSPTPLSTALSICLILSAHSSHRQLGTSLCMAINRS